MFLTCQHCVQGLKGGARYSKDSGHMHTPRAGVFWKFEVDWRCLKTDKTDIWCRTSNIRHRILTYNVVTNIRWPLYDQGHLRYRKSAYDIVRTHTISYMTYDIVYDVYIRYRTLLTYDIVFLDVLYRILYVFMVWYYVVCLTYDIVSWHTILYNLWYRTSNIVRPVNLYRIYDIVYTI